MKICQRKKTIIQKIMNKMKKVQIAKTHNQKEDQESKNNGPE